MVCGNCGTDLILGKPFCHACGTPAPATCGACGTVLEPGFRFCPDCGAAVPTSPLETENEPASRALTGSVSIPVRPVEVPSRRRSGQGVIEGERKLVTVFFCDLAGSTAIAEQLDPEEYRELLEQYVALAIHEVYRFEGIVNQLAGDGLMALFGAPIAREDAPVRAIWAAIGIHEALARLNERLRETGRPELRARIGIHTGPVVVGTVGTDLKMDYTAIGGTTNLASRLEALASPGSTLVSTETHALTRGFFDMRPVGPFAIKGKAEQVRAYEVVCRRDEVSPISIAAERGLTPLVGREQELAQLEACFERAGARLPQVVTIVGETGSGRSRLVYEFKRRLTPPPRIFEGRCVALNQRVPFYPWVTMMQRYFDITESDPPDVALRKVSARIADLDAEVQQRANLLYRMLALPVDDATEMRDTDIERETFDAVGHIFNSESKAGPVLVILEDMQWIDQPSLAMVERAIAKLHHARVMMLLTYRPDFEANWASTAVLTHMRLRRLSDQDAVEIVRNVAGGPLPPQLEELLLNKAEGSPFYTEEMTRSLLESGDLERVQGGHRLTRPVEEIRLPGTVQEVIAARLDTLDPDAKRVVQVAAVIGREFKREQVTALLDVDSIDVDTALVELERRGILHRKSIFSDANFRFGESLTQEVAYEGLLMRQRHHLHARIGRLLEEAPGEWTPERSARLAYHFVNSDDDERAGRALLRAAVDAEKVPAYNAAAAYYQEAWDLASSHASDADATAMQKLAADAALGLGRMAVLYNTPGAANLPELLRCAAAMADAAGDVGTKTSLLTYSGIETMNKVPGQFEAGLAVVEEALAHAELAGKSPPGIARALAWAYLLDGRFELARRTVDRAIGELADSAHGKTLGDVYVGTLYLRDRIELYRGHLDDAARGAHATWELAVKAGNRTVQSGSAGTLATVHFLHGEYVEAGRWAETSLAHSRSIGNPVGRHAEAAIAILATLASGSSVARARFPEFFESEIPIDGDRATSLPFIVAACLAMGEVDRALRYARSGYSSAAGRLRRMFAARSLAHALSVHNPDHTDEARALYDEAIAIAEAVQSLVDVAGARLGAAELACRRGDGPTASAHLQRAADVCHALGLAHYQQHVEALRTGLGDAVPQAVA